MKRKSILIIFIIFIFLVGAYLLFDNIRSRNYGKYEYLVSEYLQNKDEEEHDWINEDIACFNDVKVFDVTNKNLSAWVFSMCFYEFNNKIVETTGYSMAYKFNLKNDKIISYEIPKDGNEYRTSMKKLFKKSVIFKMDNINSKKMEDKVNKQAKKHFNLDEIIFGTNELISYFNLEDSIIYLYGIDSVMVEGRELRDLLQEKNYILLSKLEKDVSYDDGGTTIYKDGGSKVINSGNITVIKCNTIAGNRDIIIGDKNLKFENSFCER